MAKLQYIPYKSKENILFPPNMGDFIPEDAPVRLLDDVLEMVDISDVISSYNNSAGGRPAFHPRMLLKIVVYGYFCNIYSSRLLEEALRRDAHMLWLSSYQFPDHTTISRFKARCAGPIKSIFSSLVAILVQRGEIDLAKDLYIDGTTVRSRAARRRIKWRKSAERYSAMADDRLQKAVNELLEQVDEAEHADGDIAEARAPYTVDEAREIAGEIARRAEKEGKKVKGKIKAVVEACDSKEEHDRTVEACRGRCGIAPADPDCGIMHAKEDGYEAKATPNYNVQIATQNQYVTNYGVYDNPGDKSVAVDFIRTSVSENGVKPGAAVEDAGYGNAELYVELEGLGIEAVVKYPNFDKEISRRKPKDGEFDEFGFRLTEDGNSLICPAGHNMRIVSVQAEYTESGFRNDVTKFTCDHCSGCPFKQECQVPQKKDRTIGRRLESMRQEAKARERLLLQVNQAKLKRRNIEPEPVFGQLKHNHGYTRFRHFGKAKVRMDLGFVLMALNLRKLWNNSRKPA